MFCADDYPRPSPSAGRLLRLSRSMAFFLLRTISGLRVATLISVFRLSGQCLAYQDNVSSLAKTQVRSGRQHASSQHLPSTHCHCPDPPPPGAGDFFQVLGIFFQTETNLALLRLEVHASCAWEDIKASSSSPCKSDSNYQLPLTIPGLLLSCGDSFLFHSSQAIYLNAIF